MKTLWKFLLLILTRKTRLKNPENGADITINNSHKLITTSSINSPLKPPINLAFNQHLGGAIEDNPGSFAINTFEPPVP